MSAPKRITAPLTPSQVKATAAAINRMVAALETFGRFEDAETARRHAAAFHTAHPGRQEN